MLDFAPLTIEELRDKAEAGTLSPQDLQQIRYITRAKTIRVPSTQTERILAGVGEDIRAWREKKGITLREFGEDCLLHATFISQVENNCKASVNLETLVRLAQGMGKELQVRFVRKSRAT